MTLNRFILGFTTLIALTLPPVSLAAPTMLVTPEESAASDAAGGLLAALQSRGARIRAYGSTVSQLLDVASGKLDGNVQTQGRLWDLAAPSLVAEEVGARVTDWSGNAIFPVRTLDAAHHASIVAMPRVHRSVLQALAEGGLVVPRG